MTLFYFVMKTATCHIERKHYGHGLCKRCYMNGWNRAHPRPPTDAEYLKQYYIKNRTAILARVYVQKKQSRSVNREFVINYLLSHPCVDCGEKDIVVLEFDHVRGTKRGDVNGIIQSYTLKRVKEEIVKCEVRCANCHRRRTAQTRGSYRLMIGAASNLAINQVAV